MRTLTELELSVICEALTLLILEDATTDERKDTAMNLDTAFRTLQRAY